LIYSGLELEMGWLPLLIQGARNSKVTVGSPGNLNASDAMGSSDILEKPKGEVDRSMGDIHPSGNPHYIMNPHNGILVAELIADKLIELDRDREASYLENLDRYVSELNSKIAKLEQDAESIRGMEVVCYHVHWSYLLDWLGIETAGYIELRPGIPPSPRHKREIIDLMESRGIEVVIISSWKDPKRASEVAEAAGAELVVLPGEVDAVNGAGNYLDWMSYLVNELVDAFSVDNTGNPARERARTRRQRSGSQ
jgi:zinc/manganese transport system substrate-binding protein